jgi:hypothetical protein
MRHAAAAGVATAFVSFGLAAGDVRAGEPAGTADAKQACIAASEQAQNQRDEGHYFAARKSLLLCAREECPRVVAQMCSRWVQEIDQLVPTVVLGATDQRGQDVTDVTVLIDGQPFAKGLDGKPLEAEVGEHVFRFERPGSAPVEITVVLRAGERARAVTVNLQGTAGGSPGADGSGSASSDGTTSPRGPTARTIAAAGMIGGAVAAAGAGIVYSVLSAQNKSDAVNLRASLASDACGRSSSPACDALSAAVDSQYRDMNLATGLYTSAALLAVAGVATWFLWPHASAAPASAVVVPTQAGAVLSVDGAF